MPSPLLVVVALALASHHQPAGDVWTPPTLTPEQATEDATILVNAFADIHPGYTRYASQEDMDKASAALLALGATGPDAGAFFLGVSRYLATIRCEHTEAEPTGALGAYRAEHPTMLPVDFEWAEGRAVVVGVAPDISGVAVGDELIAVNGIPMREILERATPFIAVDGLTDHTIPSLFASTDDVGLTTFDVLFPLLAGFRETFRLSLVAPDGEARDVTVPAVDEAASLAARGAGASQSNFSDPDAVTWELIDERVAVLHVNTFVNYRTPVDPDEVFNAIFTEISASSAERLVFDLRDVGGGSDDVMGSLLRHLITEPISVGGPARVRTYDFAPHREHLRTWAEGAFDLPASMFTPDEGGMYIVNPVVAGAARSISPAPNAWGGELVLLIGHHNESGATILLSELRHQRAVTLIGQPTGGSAEGPTAGVLAFLTLPNSGLVARLPLLRTRTSAPTFEPGMGIAPDILVAPTVEDIRAGRDPVMEAAVRP